MTALEFDEQPPEPPTEPPTAEHTPVKPRRRRRTAVLASAAVVLNVGAVAAVGALYVSNRSDAADRASEGSVAQAAGDGAVAVLSYRADTVDADLAHATTFLTGAFLDYYSGFGTQVVAPAAKERGITSQVSVTGTSVVSASPEQAVALVFVDQNVTEKNSPAPVAAASSLRIELTRVGNAWLISKLDPI